MREGEGVEIESGGNGREELWEVVSIPGGGLGPKRVFWEQHHVFT